MFQEHSNWQLEFNNNHSKKPYFADLFARYYMNNEILEQKDRTIQELKETIEVSKYVNIVLIVNRFWS